MSRTFDLSVARLNRGLSVNQAAREIGVHRRTLEKLEAGVAVHPEVAKKVADFYEVQVVDVLPLGNAA